MSEVAPFTAARESALHPANLLVGASGSGVSEASAVQKQMSGSLQVQVGPGSDAGLAVAKETTAHTATSAAVRQDAVETRDAGDVTELEEPLVIHAPSDVEDSTSPVVKSEAPEGGGQWESSARLGEVNGFLSADVRTPAFAWKASPRVQRGQRLLFPKAFLFTTAAGSFTATIVSTTIQEPS